MIFVIHIGLHTFHWQVRYVGPSDLSEFVIGLSWAAYICLGVAVLAYLYWQLGFVTWSVVKQISGYLTLLEAWIYEHFKHCRPTPMTSDHGRHASSASLGFLEGFWRCYVSFTDTSKGSWQSDSSWGNMLILPINSILLIMLPFYLIDVPIHLFASSVGSLSWAQGCPSIQLGCLLHYLPEMYGNSWAIPSW